MKAPNGMDQETLALIEKQMHQQSERAILLQEADPRLPYVSAYVMAGDIIRGEYALDMLRKGEWSWAEAEIRTGSYARFGLRVSAWEEGLITIEDALTDLGPAWRGADPDDTDPRFLSLWIEAKRRHGNYIRDGRPLPRTHILTLYRGQDADAPLGIAWSLDRMTALKFANGAATRQHDRGGTILTRHCWRRDALAFL